MEASKSVEREVEICNAREPNVATGGAACVSVSRTRVARRVQAGVGVCAREAEAACDGPWLGA